VEDVAAWSRARGLTSREQAALLAGRALEAWLLEAGPAAFGLDRAPPAAPRTLAAVDAAARARVDSLVAAAGDAPALRADEAAFIAAWARDAGVRCPRAERDACWAGWALGSAAARRDAAAVLGISPGQLRRMLEERALAEWVAARGPGGLGRMNDIDLGAVQELQFSRPIAEILAQEAAR
jgi:hypothetical protein